MKKILLSLFLTFTILSAKATIHVIQVWDGYFQFVPTELTIQLGDTIQWLPLDQPLMTHTITSADIPAGAEAFDEVWQAPADTFFQYVPAFAGVYNYVCTPHAVSFNMIGSFTVEDATNSIAEQSLSKVKLYPNPAYDQLHVSGLADGIPYSIVALDGKVVAEGELSSKINISFLDPGYYLIRFTGDRSKAIKFQKK
jgi:plastocyanin